MYVKTDTNIMYAQINVMDTTSAFFPLLFSSIFSKKFSIHIYTYVCISYLDCIPHNKFSVLSSGTHVSHCKLKLSYCNTQTSVSENTAAAEHSLLSQERLLTKAKPLLLFTPVVLIVCLTL